MKEGIFHHIRTYVIRGFLTLIPLAITFFVLRLAYFMIDQKVMYFVNKNTGLNIPGLGILLLVLLLYGIGLVTSNVLGKQLFHWIEHLSKRIPVVKTVYQVGKQLSLTLSLPERKVFKKALMVRLPHSNIWTMAFLIGSVRDTQSGGILLKLFLPTPPNPTSGYLIFAPEAETRDTLWSVEEALKYVISDGIISPETIF
jgi:uncharacterized membrane protein